jgi:hypothetical protein
MNRSTAAESEPKYDLVSPRFFADSHAVFRRMRAEDRNQHDAPALAPDRACEHVSPVDLQCLIRGARALPVTFRS